MGFIRIFKNINYLFIAVLTVCIVFLSLTFFANISIFYNVLFDGELKISTKINIIANIPYGYISEFSLRSLFAVLFSLLFSINLIGIIYYVRLYRATALSAVAALGSGSLLSAILGVGCISCGSLLVAFLASLLGASSLAIILPLGGPELNFISITFLLISVIIMNNKIKKVWSR